MKMINPAKRSGKNGETEQLTHGEALVAATPVHRAKEHFAEWREPCLAGLMRDDSMDTKRKGGQGNAGTSQVLHCGASRLR